MLVKAVIVVGRGSWGHSRVRGSSTIPALEPVANRPIVQHVLDRLRAASITEVIVVGAMDTLVSVRGCLDGQGHRLDRVEYAVSGPRPDAAATLRSVAALVGDSPCVVQPADGLFGEPVASLLPCREDDAPDLILPLADLTKALDDGDNGSAPAPASGTADPTGVVAIFGAGALFRASELVGPTERADLAAIGERLITAGATVRFRLVESWRRYDGNGADLLELNRIALDELIADVGPSVRRENRIEGRVSVHPGAAVRTSVIVGPAAIDDGAIVEDAYVGPYTSIGAGARVEGSEIERSIISPGASVLHVGGRVVSSLVGRNARVFRDFSLPRAMRLWVGDGDEVGLC